MDLVARRYALALTQEADQAGQADAVDADVTFIAETFEGSRDLRTALQSPVVSAERKKAVLTSLFRGRLTPLAERFVGLMATKDRASLLPAVATAYGELRDAQTGTVEALVRTARPLASEDAERLRAQIEARMGGRVRLRVEIDPDLIGGLVVRVGDLVFDRSVRHQLDVLRDGFAERAAVFQN